MYIMPLSIVCLSLDKLPVKMGHKLCTFSTNAIKFSPVVQILPNFLSARAEQRIRISLVDKIGSPGKSDEA